MLTADLVRARRQGGKLVLSELKAGTRKRALEIGEELLAIAREHVGEPRGALLEAFRSVEVGPREHKLAEGLKKLVLDTIEFEAEGELDPAELRDQVFRRASEVRAALPSASSFDRAALLESIAAEHGLDAAELERRLYADLREAHRQLGAPTLGRDELLERYELGQAQAVLLRAERIVVDATCRSPAAYRALFRKLKFLRLLHTIERTETGGYRITIDGPYSLFASVTKYGRELAMLLPALRGCQRFTLRADLRWGKAREPLRFELEERSRRGEHEESSDLPVEASALLTAFERRGSAWRAEPSDTILDLPGVGTCVPDLVFTHAKTGECVYFELLGYWSRDAVFRRVEMVESGLPVRILFGVPDRLRVSEALLPDPLPGALLVFREQPSPAQVEAKLDELAGRIQKTT